MPDITEEIQANIDSQIDQIASLPYKQCVAGFTVAGAILGAGSGAMTFGTTTVPGWVAGGAAGAAGGAAACKLLVPAVQKKMESLKSTQASASNVHLLGIPSNLKTAQNLSSHQIVHELRRTRHTIRGFSTVA